MLRDTLKQTRLLFGPAIYKKTIPEDHYYRKLDGCIDWKRPDALCRHLYCENNGRPVKNFPRMMFKAEVLQYLYNWTDREVREQAQYNIAVKWFLELGLDEEPFDFTALSKFRTKLGKEMHTELLVDILQQIKETGFLDHILQFTDTTAVEGDVAVCTTAQLIVNACTLVIKRLKEEGYTVAVTFEKKEQLQTIVEKAFILLEETEHVGEVEYEREMLKSILEDYIEIKDGTAQERKKKGKNRIVSVTDPDVRWGAKSDDEMWAGYKTGFTMTENRFITSVMVTPASVADDKVAIPLYKQQLYPPEILVGDGAFGTGENRQYFKAKECTLVAPLRGQENRTKLFPKSKFKWDDHTVTCPAGKTTEKFTENKKSKCYAYRFSKTDCQSCPLKCQCTTGQFRTVSISYYQKEFDEAAEFNNTPEYKALMKKRPLIESKNSEMKHPHGMYRARYRGVDRVTIQALLTAIVVNLKNFIRLLQEAAQQPSQRKLSISSG